MYQLANGSMLLPWKVSTVLVYWKMIVCIHDACLELRVRLSQILYNVVYCLQPKLHKDMVIGSD